MHGIPIDFPKDVFLGKTIEMISFSLNQMTIHFNDNIFISIESSFSLNKTEEKCDIQIIPVKNSNIMKIIGQKVVDVKIEDSNKTIFILLTDGYELRCYDDSSNYESLKINLQGIETVI